MTSFEIATMFVNKISRSIKIATIFLKRIKFAVFKIGHCNVRGDISSSKILTLFETHAQ